MGWEEAGSGRLGEEKVCQQGDNCPGTMDMFSPLLWKLSHRPLSQVTWKIRLSPQRGIDKCIIFLYCLSNKGYRS